MYNYVCDTKCQNLHLGASLEKVYVSAGGGEGVSPAEPIGAEPMYKPMEDKGNHNDLYCPPYKTSPAIESQVTRHEAILLRFKDTS